MIIFQPSYPPSSPCLCMGVHGVELFSVRSLIYECARLVVYILLVLCVCIAEAIVAGYIGTLYRLLYIYALY